jgi:excisionase family DNA binding protein
MQLIEQKPETLAEFRAWATEAIHHCEVMLDDEARPYYAGLVQQAKRHAIRLGQFKLADSLPHRHVKCPADAILRLREVLANDTSPIVAGPHVMLTVKQAADVLQISTDTIYNLAREGVLPHKRVGRQFRFHPTDLEEYQREAPKLRVLR